jgi:hypothetical protein
MPRRLPAPWTAEKIPGGYIVRDASGQANDARRVAANIGKGRGRPGTEQPDAPSRPNRLERPERLPLGLTRSNAGTGSMVAGRGDRAGELTTR